MSLHRDSARVVTRSGALGLVADLAELFKLRIGAMVFFAAIVGARLASLEAPVSQAIEAGFWVLLLGAGASAFNQVFEREIDRLMPRTRNRPLPSGRMRTRDAIWIGAALCAAGTLGLALRFNLLSALLGLSTFVGYAVIYTPLKRVSYFNTVVGAIPGAMPPLLGYAAVAGSIEGWGWYLFAVLFTWQFPHFLAIAWMYREEYARAGLRMLPSLPASEGVAGRQALAYALVLVPLSVLPAVRGDAGALYLWGALALGVIYAAAAALFALHESRPRARLLLFTSLAYLPLVFSLALADPLVRGAVLP